MTETYTDQPVNPVTAPKPRFQNYWGSQTIERFTFPDEEQWIEFRVMNEGDKRKYQQKTNRDITIERTGGTKVGIDPASDRHILIKMSVTGWNLWKPVDPEDPNTEWQQVDFGPRILDTWLEEGDPKVIQDLEQSIRMANPWMQADMSVEEIDKEIERLEEVKAQVSKREQEKAASGNR